MEVSHSPGVTLLEHTHRGWGTNGVTSWNAFSWTLTWGAGSSTRRKSLAVAKGRLISCTTRTPGADGNHLPWRSQWLLLLRRLYRWRGNGTHLGHLKMHTHDMNTMCCCNKYTVKLILLRKLKETNHNLTDYSIFKHSNQYLQVCAVGSWNSLLVHLAVLNKIGLVSLIYVTRG